MYEIFRTMQRECPMRRIHMFCARFQFTQTIKLIVDPLEGSGKDLLAFPRVLGGATKMFPTRLSLAS